LNEVWTNFSTLKFANNNDLPYLQERFELKRLNNLASNNENVNKNDDSNTEVIYASADWHNVIP